MEQLHEELLRLVDNYEIIFADVTSEKPTLGRTQVEYLLKNTVAFDVDGYEWTLKVDGHFYKSLPGKDSILVTDPSGFVSKTQRYTNRETSIITDSSRDFDPETIFSSPSNTTSNDSLWLPESTENSGEYPLGKSSNNGASEYEFTGSSESDWSDFSPPDASSRVAAEIPESLSDDSWGVSQGDAYDPSLFFNEPQNKPKKVRFRKTEKSEEFVTGSVVDKTRIKIPFGVFKNLKSLAGKGPKTDSRNKIIFIAVLLIFVIVLIATSNTSKKANIKSTATTLSGATTTTLAAKTSPYAPSTATIRQTILNFANQNTVNFSLTTAVTPAEAQTISAQLTDYFAQGFFITPGPYVKATNTTGTQIWYLRTSLAVLSQTQMQWVNTAGLWKVTKLPVFSG